MIDSSTGIKNLFLEFKDSLAPLGAKFFSTPLIPLPLFFMAVSFSNNGRVSISDFMQKNSFASSDLNFSNINICGIRNKTALPRGSYRVRSLIDIPNFLDQLSISDATKWIGGMINRIVLGDDSKDHKNSLKLLTFNVCGLPTPIGTMPIEPRRFLKIGKAIRKLNVDIIALQEMWDSSTQVLFKAAKYPHYFSEFSQKESTFLYGRSGLAIMSKYPLRDCEQLSFTRKSGLEWLVRKGALYARVETPEGEIDIYNVHLASEPERLNKLFVSKHFCNQIRYEQLFELKDWILRRKKPGVPVYILGDFNFIQEDPLYQFAQKSFGEDIYRSRFGNTCDEQWEDNTYQQIVGATFDPVHNLNALSNSGAPERLDYIWRENNQDSIAFSADRVFVDDPLSDHYGVLAEITK